VVASGLVLVGLEPLFWLTNRLMTMSIAIRFQFPVPCALVQSVRDAHSPAIKPGKTFSAVICKTPTMPQLHLSGWWVVAGTLSKMLTLEKLSIECGINIYVPRCGNIFRRPNTQFELVKRKQNSQQLPSVGLGCWITIMSRALRVGQKRRQRTGTGTSTLGSETWQGVCSGVIAFVLSLVEKYLYQNSHK